MRTWLRLKQPAQDGDRESTVGQGLAPCAHLCPVQGAVTSLSLESCTSRCQPSGPSLGELVRGPGPGQLTRCVFRGAGVSARWLGLRWATERSDPRGTGFRGHLWGVVVAGVEALPGPSCTLCGGAEAGAAGQAGGRPGWLGGGTAPSLLGGFLEARTQLHVQSPLLGSRGSLGSAGYGSATCCCQ